MLFLGSWLTRMKEEMAQEGLRLVLTMTTSASDGMDGGGYTKATR